MRKDLGIGIMIFLLAFVIYLPAFWWGAPQVTGSAPELTRSWGTDDLSPLGPLADVYNLFRPQPDRNLGYPMLHPFILAGAYSPYLAYLWVTGNLHGLSATYPFGLADPAGTLKTLTYIAHLVSVLMGAGIVMSAYYTGKILWSRRTGILTAVILLVSYPMFYYSRTGNVDVPMLFFIAIASVFFARCLVAGLNPKPAFWMGLFGGLALGLKEQAFAVFIGFPVVLLPLHYSSEGTAGRWRRWKFWKPILISIATVLIAFGIASGLFVAPERYFAHLQFMRLRMAEVSQGNVLITKALPFTLEGNITLADAIGGYLIDSMTLLGFLLALVGIIYAIVKERRQALFLVPAVTYLIVLFISARFAYLRYLLPAVYILSFYTARAITAGWETAGSPGLAAFGRIVLRGASVVAAVWVIGLNLLYGIDLTYAMLRDSRYAAGKWLAENTLPGDRISYFGIPWSLPPLKDGIEIEPASPFEGFSKPIQLDQAAANAVLHNWTQRQPDFIILVPDYTSPTGTPYSGACPPAVCEGLLHGSLNYRLAARFETAPIFPWLNRPPLDYPTVNPPIHIFVPTEG